MAITREDVAALAKAYLDCVIIEKGTAAEQQKFFLHPDPTLFLLRGDDMTLQQNYELHQKLTDEKHWSVAWDVTPLCDKPERARATGTAYWEARVIGKPQGGLIKAFLYEDWIVQRMPSGELKIVVFMNANHSFLPGSAILEI
jgi:hypothetical protein